MGWFTKKEGKNFSPKDIPPSLPKLPELPTLPDLEEDEMEIHQLPSFPTSSLGEKFSQNTIKEAVSGFKNKEYDRFPGEKEVEEVFDADEFVSQQDNSRMMPKTSKEFQKVPQRGFVQPKIKEMSFQRKEFKQPEKFKMPPRKEMFEEPEYHPSEFPQRQETRPQPQIQPRSSTGPVFIRIDKFEDSVKALDKTKTQISEIEKSLQEIYRIKEEEKRELDSWMSEVLKIKEQIEKVERDIFSKIE